MVAARKVYIHPLPLRIWHWLHGVGVLILIGTGAQLRFPGEVHLLPNLRLAAETHSTVGLLITFSFFAWFCYHAMFAGTLVSLYLPQQGELRERVPHQLNFYFRGFFRGERNPHQPTPTCKFNPLEKLLYLLVMLGFFPTQMITGMALKSLSPPWKIIDLFGSIKVLIGIHFIFGCLILAFLILHIYLSTLGVTFWSRFRTIVHGWTEDNE